MPKALWKRTKKSTAAPTPASRRSGRIAAMAEAAASPPAAASTLPHKVAEVKKGPGSKAAGGMAAEEKQGKLSRGTNTNDARRKTTASGRQGLQSTTDTTGKPSTKRTTTDRKNKPKNKDGKKTRRKTATSAIKTREKAAAVRSTKASANVKKKGATPSTSTKMDKANKASKMATTTSEVKQTSPATYDATVDAGVATASPPSEFEVSTPISTATANVPKDTIDPNRPVFYPSHFPHIMSSIIAMCDLAEQVKFRGVSRWCQEEAHRIIRRTPSDLHTMGGYMLYPCEWVCFDRIGQTEVPPHFNWAIGIIDHTTADYWPWASPPPDCPPVVLAHTVRYYVVCTTNTPFFTPGLGTAVLFFPFHHLGFYPTPSISPLLNPNPAKNSHPRNPTITKLVLNTGTGDGKTDGEGEMMLNRLTTSILSAPASVTNLTIVFAGTDQPATWRGSAKFWETLLDALWTKKNTAVTLVNAALVYPESIDRFNPSTFAQTHQEINTLLREEAENGLCVTAMTLEEYKTKVGEKQFKIDTVWKGDVVVT